MSGGHSRILGRPADKWRAFPSRPCCRRLKVWHTLASLPHPAGFGRLAADRRREPDPGKRLADDDVTLLRVRMRPGRPSLLLAFR